MLKRSFYFVWRWAHGSPATFLLHLAFAVIILGACVTYFWGEQGTVTLNAGTTATASDAGDVALPFGMTLRKAEIKYYPASTAAADFVSTVEITDDGSVSLHEITMRDMLIHRHYRFTQVSMGVDSVILTVNHDPWGIGISYTGYALLLISMAWFFFQRHTGFRGLLKMFGRKMLTAMGCLLALNAQAAPVQVRDVVPDEVARTFGKIYVYWDERPALMQTMSRAILREAYGSEQYEGLSAEQVTLGWIIHYDQWKREPLIRIKSDKVREILDVDGDYARLTDFYDRSGYKLQRLLDSGDKDAERVDRSVQLITSLCTGRLMRIYPYMSANGRMEWLSWTDNRPSRMPLDQWEVVTNSMGHVARYIHTKDADRARSALLDIRDYQIKTAEEGGAPLSPLKFRAEVIYNRIASPLLPSLVLLAAGLLMLAAGRRRWVVMAAKGVTITALIWLLSVMALRWVVAAHWPLTNGPESMETMALVTLIAGMWLMRRLGVMLPMAMIVAAMALAVAAMSGNATVISPLMPVLNSPLLSVHVLVIMTAYALLAIILLLSLGVMAARGGKGKTVAANRLSQMSLMLLYPAVFLLAAGIFIGAIWANQSWGRYWGWDPKETWALITMIVYSVPLHWRRIGWLRRPRWLAIYLSLSFLSVLITYFGVNFLLGGLHSYAS